MEKIDAFIGSSFGKKLIIGVGSALLVLMVFHAGYVAGARHSGPDRHGKRWKFNGPGHLEMRMPPDFIRDGHGAIGEISEITPEYVKVVGPDGSTTTVWRTEETVVHGVPGSTSSASFDIGSHVMVLGKPGEDGLTAKLIRIIPPPPSRY